MMTGDLTSVGAAIPPSQLATTPTPPSSSLSKSSKFVRFDIKHYKKSPMPTPMASIPEQIRPNFNRSHDRVACHKIQPWPLKEFYYALTCVPPRASPPKEKLQPKNMVFFSRTTSSIRYNIYHFTFGILPGYKQVTLSRDFATQDVFPPDHFITPWEILKDVKGALLSCREMHDEVMTFFWQTYRFHVTFSPFTVGPTFSGLSIKWLNMYADRVNHLTVEIDLTKLSYSASQNADLLKPALSKLDQVILDLVKALHRRKDKNRMSDLHLMVRRYAGLRPLPEGAAEDAVRVPYCPRYAITIAWTFRFLRGDLYQIRMSGFDEAFFQKMAKMMFENPVYSMADWPAWPDYTPPTPGSLVRQMGALSMTPNTPGSGSAGNATPRPGSGLSFATSRPDSSRPGSSLTLREASDAGDNTLGLGISAGLRASPSFRKRVEEESARSAGNIHESLFHATIPTALRRELTGTFDSTANYNESGAGSDDEPDAAINPFARTAHQSTGGADKGSSSFARTAHQSTGGGDNGSPSAAVMSPEKMNSLNEQDPAYGRALVAMNAARQELLEDEEKEKARAQAQSNSKKGGNKRKKGGKKH